MTKKRSWLTYAIAMPAGLAVASVGAYWTYAARMQVFRGASETMAGDELGVTVVAEGVFGTMVSRAAFFIFLLAAVFGVIIVLRAMWPGIAVGLTAALPAFAANMSVGRYVAAQPRLAEIVSTQVVSTSNWATSAIGSVLAPTVLGAAAGFFTYRYLNDKDLRAANRPQLLSRAEIEQRDAELRGREQHAAEAMRRQAQGLPVPEQEPAGPPPSQPRTVTERKSITCPSCGAANAPVREACLMCGAALVRPLQA